MKFVGVKELRYHPMDIIKGLTKDNEVVVTMNGRPKAILMAVEGDQVESCIKSIRQSKAALAVTRIQENSTKLGMDKTSDNDIDKEINAVRKARRRA